MIKLNLLPSDHKKKLELANLKRLTLSLVSRIFVVLLAFTFILSAIFFYVAMLVRYQEQLIKNKQEDAKMQLLISMEEKVSLANRKIERVDEKHRSVYWTEIMESLADLVPSDIYLTGFHYGAENGEVRLSGWAPTRDRFLAFQDILKDSPLFAEVEVPLSNLLKQTNINFDLILKPAL